MSLQDRTGLQAPEIETVLLPIDDEGASMTAVDHAAAIADRYEAALHALYVYGPERARVIEDVDADHDALAEEVRSVLEGVGEACQKRSVWFSSSTAMGFSTSRLAQHPGSVILDIAEDVDADLLVIPRTSDDESPAVLEKAAEYVVAYASQPVLSV